MADKITNFEDYKKKGNVEDTTDIDIQIEDPYNFFNEQEREEYFQERQKELSKEKEKAVPEHDPVRPKRDETAEDTAVEDIRVEKAKEKKAILPVFTGSSLENSDSVSLFEEMSMP